MHHESASPCANVRVGEGDTLALGSVRLGFLHTPGHTTDTLTVVVGDRLLTADFLFIGEGGALSYRL